MKNLLLCCLLATLLPCVLSATLQVNSDGGDKLSVWLKSRLRREICMPDSLEDSGEFQQQNEDTDSVTHRHSGQSERVKRGCNLLTCSVHDLAHRLNQLRERTNNAPPAKISPHGYGRRRRRSLPQLSAAEMGGQGHVKLNRHKGGGQTLHLQAAGTPFSTLYQRDRTEDKDSGHLERRGVCVQTCLVFTIWRSNRLNRDSNCSFLEQGREDQKGEKET
ncbi:hypothetical protein AOLI_G00096780 [Acnodon oligacanthus]